MLLNFIQGNSITLFIYKTKLFAKKPTQIFSAQAKPKLKWNEEFKLHISDPEIETVGIRLCPKSNFNCKSNDIIGFIEFPLRSSVRNCDRPGLFKWFTIKSSKTNDVGELLLFIEYFDSRQITGPLSFRHLSHVEIGNFQSFGLPPEIRTIFSPLSARFKSDRHNNNDPELLPSSQRFPSLPDPPEQIPLTLDPFITLSPSRSNSTNTEEKSKPSPRDNSQEECIICFEAKKDTVFYKCGHLACCYTCAENMMKKEKGCPICRASILDITKVFIV